MQCRDVAFGAGQHAHPRRAFAGSDGRDRSQSWSALNSFDQIGISVRERTDEESYKFGGRPLHAHVAGNQD